MIGYFITATGTDTGKTLVTSLLIRLRLQERLPVHALKPVITGLSVTETIPDSLLLLDALERETSDMAMRSITPFLFDDPVSPHIAAARESQPIDPAALMDFCKDEMKQHSCTFIEGVGGTMVPLTPTWTTLDWMEALGLPVILVTGGFLGSLSYTLTAMEAMRQRGLRLSGIVVSARDGMPISEKEHLGTLAAFTTAPLIIVPPLDLGPCTLHDRNVRLDAMLGAMPGFRTWANEAGVL